MNTLLVLGLMEAQLKLMSISLQIPRAVAAEVPVIISPPVPQILQAIARCESGNRQFNEDGTILRGKVNPQDVGKWQINLRYHQKTAEEMGIDLFTEKGNEEYALYLFNKNGTRDWLASAKCWDK